MRYARFKFNSTRDAAEAASLVSSKYPSIEAEPIDNTVHVYAEGERPLFGELRRYLSANGINPIGVRLTWAMRLATLARRHSLDASIDGDASVCIANASVEDVLNLYDIARRRKLGFSVHPHGGYGEFDIRACVELTPGETTESQIHMALYCESLRLAERRDY